MALWRLRSVRLKLLALAMGVAGGIAYATWPGHSECAGGSCASSVQAQASSQPLIEGGADAARKVMTLPAAGGMSPTDEAAMQRIYAAFATGDFVGALAQADSAAIAAEFSAEFRQWLGQQMPSLLISAGWAKLRLGDCDQGIEWLRRAAAIEPVPSAVKGLAVCYYKQKHMMQAREYFLTYLAEQPSDSEMLLLYTDVLESEGRFTDAVEILKQLVALADKPGSNLDKATLSQRLTSMQGRERESSSMQTEASRNFRLTFRSGDHEDLVAFVMQALEDAVDEYHESYGLPAPQSPIEVVMYPSNAFQSVTAGGPSWAEGLYDGRIRIPVRQASQTTDRADLDVVLRHELVHALLALVDDSRSLPSWFSEGIAQRLSCANRACSGFQFPPTAGGFLPQDSFITSYLALSAVNAGRAYQQSLFMVMAIEALKGEQALRQILTNLTTNSDLSSDGLMAPIGLNFSALYNSSSDYWKRRQVPSSR